MSDTAAARKIREKYGLFSSPVLRQRKHLLNDPFFLLRKKMHQIHQKKSFPLEIIQTFRASWSVWNTTGLSNCWNHLNIRIVLLQTVFGKKTRTVKGFFAAVFLLGILLALFFSLFLMLAVVTNSLFRICFKLFIMSNLTKLKSKFVQRSRWHQLLQIHWNRSVNRK